MNICPKKPSFSFFAKNNNSPNVVVTIPKEPTQLSSNTDFEIIRIKTSIEINENVTITNSKNEFVLLIVIFLKKFHYLFF